MIGCKLSGSTNWGGARTWDFVMAPPPAVGNVARSYWPISTCSSPRFSCALPASTVICCSLVSGSLRTAARLFSRSEATAFSKETSAFEPGTCHVAVCRSTCPEVMCTPTCEALSWSTIFSSTVTSVSPFTVYVVPSANAMRATPSEVVWIKSPLSSVT